MLLKKGIKAIVEKDNKIFYFQTLIQKTVENEMILKGYDIRDYLLDFYNYTVDKDSENEYYIDRV